MAENFSFPNTYSGLHSWIFAVDIATQNKDCISQTPCSGQVSYVLNMGQKQIVTFSLWKVLWREVCPLWFFFLLNKKFETVKAILNHQDYHPECCCAIQKKAHSPHRTWCPGGPLWIRKKEAPLPPGQLDQCLRTLHKLIMGLISVFWPSVGSEQQNHMWQHSWDWRSHRTDQQKFPRSLSP